MFRNIYFFMFLTISACSSGPYSVIEGRRDETKDLNSHAVRIVSVDGVYPINKTVARVKPGVHIIKVASARLGGGAHKEITLDAKPCMKYILSAQHESSIYSIDRWEITSSSKPLANSCNAADKSNN